MDDLPSNEYNLKTLTPEEEERLRLQDTRLVSDFKALQLEKDAKKHWDLFYKRNETRFFKDRHWTTREFCDLLDIDENPEASRILWEVGCGVGNFVFPLIEAKLNFEYIVCDLSSKAIELVKQHGLYDEKYIKALQGDITDPEIVDKITSYSKVDVATLIFVLSAVHPDKFVTALKNIYECLKPGGVLLFRDYGLHDMAQLRFKAGHKIAENFYMRQDGTRLALRGVVDHPVSSGQDCHGSVGLLCALMTKDYEI
ncbi:tRNA N(3)-methylcytidine methyltransferase METTL6 isoform X2 [Atheta coriaria]|uniref:tRNA N(3)-methylcytidine methyltransferase METTL6 isoform X2 n=1 Tax=Dalotia coriaria TaxID=877792 RepID=UPI0031F443DD